MTTIVRSFALLLFAVLAITLFSCASAQKNKVEIADWDAIKEKGELTIITLYSSTSYFNYKDEAMGYDYELALDFCIKNGLNINVVVAENVTRLVEMLNNGEGDLIAYSLPYHNDLKEKVTYCGLNKVTYQVLVQRKAKKEERVSDVTQLIGKEVFVKFDTKYHQRLTNLNEELGGGIIIKDIARDTINSEDLIGMVARKEIDYTVSDEYLAKLNRTYFNNLDVTMPISFDQRISWAVNKQSPKLADKLNEWYKANNNTRVYKDFLKKYFEISKNGDDTDLELPRDRKIGTISPYDDIFKRCAEGTQYDWHMLAAISYQESRFRNNLKSWAGAAGIMGLMRRTAESLDLADQDRMNPELSVRASIRLMNRLDRLFKDIEDKNERLKFILAAYNGGMGHITDAQRLAKKYGANPHIWEGNVKEYVKLKRYPEYYNDPICKSGYFRGSETIRYVFDVTNNTKRFKELAN